MVVQNESFFFWGWYFLAKGLVLKLKPLDMKYMSITWLFGGVKQDEEGAAARKHWLGLAGEVGLM